MGAGEDVLVLEAEDELAGVDGLGGVHVETGVQLRMDGLKGDAVHDVTDDQELAQ